MVSKIDQSKALNVVRSTTYFKNKANVTTNAYRSSIRSTYIKNNIIYKNTSTIVSQQQIVSNHYPGYSRFGIQNTTQNIYSAGPNKLRIGIY